jgi:hypothetical protein
VRAAAAEESGEAKSIQAGIVLADRPGYTCFSLSDIGLPEGAQVENLQSSCECVKPSLIQYLAADQQSRTGMLLEFVPEAPDPAVGPGVDAEVRAARLAVNVDLELAEGQTHRFTVHLLHSVPAAMEDS